MPARILDPATTEVQPPQWRKRVTERTAPAPRHAARPEPVEQAVLQARLEQLSAEMEAKVLEARQAGFRDGDVAGREAGSAVVEAAVACLADAVAKLAATRRDVIHRAEEDVVRLSTEVARRVLHRELSIDRSALEALIKAALLKLESQEVYRVRISPEHEDLLRRCLNESGRGAGVEVIADPAQPLGGAIFEMSRGLLDASVDTQLREIERGLADQLQVRQ